jgi:bifunctional DNA-binding transcriptional regulator/antitoxin component of YhaV-PrlF toxin-antitoxin module
MSRRYKGREYPKWMITIPPRQVEELGWAEGEFLESDVASQELVIRKENSQTVEKRREVAKKAWQTRRRTRERTP